LLDHGARIDEKGPRGLTALIFAVLRNRHKTCSLLLERGASATVQDDQGLCVIHHAIVAERFDLLRSLLERHPDAIDVADHTGATPLMYCATRGYVDAVYFLLDSGASLDSCTPEGRTALSCAASAGHVSACQLLLQHGASYDSLAQRNSQAAALSPLCEATLGGHLEVVRQP
jgi:ankyrin repeat protein